jgi:hypothetical protein
MLVIYLVLLRRYLQKEKVCQGATAIDLVPAGETPTNTVGSSEVSAIDEYVSTHCTTSPFAIQSKNTGPKVTRNHRRANRCTATRRAAGRVSNNARSRLLIISPPS